MPEVSRFVTLKVLSKLEVQERIGDRMASKNKIVLTVVVSGTSTEVEANVNSRLHTVVNKALEQTGNTGQPPENWELRDASGKTLDTESKVEDSGIVENVTLFLNLKAGVGG